MAARPNTDAELREAVDALEACNGNQTHASRMLGLPRCTLQGRLQAAALRGIGSTRTQLETLHGNNPKHDLTHVVPAPMILRGTSSLYGDDGSLKLQWVKTKLDDSKMEEAIRAAIDALAEKITPVKPIARPNHTIKHLCNLYTLTDAHVGMKSWKEETGADWDLDIAERVLMGAFDYLIAASPPAHTCVVNNLGDFMHFDSLSAVTPTNEHLLDADSRYAKVVKTAVRILRYIVNRSLQRHNKVIVLMAEGNHDPASSVWLRHIFGLLYEKERRVEVIDTEAPYYVYQHGTTMLAFHHGHMKKAESLPGLFAAQYPVMWGSTTKRYCHIGHTHCHQEQEQAGMKVTRHSTLAARDAYAARGGWISERQITAITYHVEYGQVATTTVTPEMLDGQ